jgi:hypothetical protein
MSPEKAVVSASNSKSAHASSGVSVGSSMKVGAGDKADHLLKIGEHQSSEGVVCSLEVDAVRCGLVHKRVAETERKGVDNTYVAFSSTSASKKSESASVHAVLASLPPTVVNSSTSTSTRWDSRNRCSQKIKGGNVFDRQRMFSAKAKIFASRTTVLYRPRNSGGNIIKSIAPEIKPRPQWCPKGLTHTQKRRVQRLRALEIKEAITLKKCDELFRRVRPMVPPNMTWREKRITTEENINADDMVADGISEISRDTLI